MYSIKLLYDPAPKTQTLKESITYCASVMLERAGIQCFQTSASCIAFESDRDRVLGLLLLSNSSSFQAVCVDV